MNIAQNCNALPRKTALVGLNARMVHVIRSVVVRMKNALLVLYVKTRNALKNVVDRIQIVWMERFAKMIDVVYQHVKAKKTVLTVNFVKMVFVLTQILANPMLIVVSMKSVKTVLVAPQLDARRMKSANMDWFVEMKIAHQNRVSLSCVRTRIRVIHVQ